MTASTGLVRLRRLTGLGPVKEEVEQLYQLQRTARLRRNANLPEIELSRHLVFTGNPGTGKTTVARIVAEIYGELGVLPKNHVVEVSRVDLVGGFIGQTALKTEDVVTRALGGILFIDEAYALAREGQSDRDFGREAVDTLVALMENHRHELAVIVAGYPAEMEAFIDSNPGLRSRFTRTIHFPDYTNPELVEIFQDLAQRSGMILTHGALERASATFASMPRRRGFGNGREVRRLFEASVARQALRLGSVAVPTRDQLRQLKAEDVPGSREEAVGVVKRAEALGQSRASSGDSRENHPLVFGTRKRRRAGGDGSQRLSGFGVSAPGWVSDTTLEHADSVLFRRARHHVFGEGTVIFEDLGRPRSVIIRFADGEREVPFGLGLVEIEDPVPERQ